MYKLYLLALIVSGVATYFLTFGVKKLAVKYGVMDIPDARRVHTVPIPRWGGLAMFGGFVISMLTLLIVSKRFHLLLAYRNPLKDNNGDVIGMLSIGQQFIGIIVALVIIIILGMIDDKKSVPPVPKLLTQIIAAYVAMDFGVRIFGLELPWGIDFVAFPIIVTQILTVFWLIGFMNTINLIDGLDGLAAGVVAIAAFTFLIVAILQGQTQDIFQAKQLKLAAILAAGLCGACVGFLFHNFYPAKIFMGDTGALFLGFMLGTIAVIGTLKTAAVISLIIPVLVIALPVLDVAMAIIRRLMRRQSIMAADKEHFHHRLLSLGWSQREAVLFIYVLSIVLSETAIIITIFRAMPLK
ncbi:MAG: MraY family glycosyltransferase [Elusimicrobiota bacterium]